MDGARASLAAEYEFYAAVHEISTSFDRQTETPAC